MLLSSVFRIVRSLYDSDYRTKQKKYIDGGTEKHELDVG